MNNLLKTINYNIINKISFCSSNYILNKTKQASQIKDIGDNKELINCITKIAYNLTNSEINYTYVPPYKMMNGWCIQNKELIWTINDKSIHKFEDCEISVLVNVNVNVNAKSHGFRNLDYVPCFKFDEYGQLTSMVRIPDALIDIYYPLNKSFEM